MVSAISAISANIYTAMANNSAYNYMQAGNSRIGMLSSPEMYNVNFGSLKTLSAMDTQLEIEMLTNSLQYKMAKAMLEQIKKQEKEDSNRFSVLA